MKVVPLWMSFLTGKISINELWNKTVQSLIGGSMRPILVLQCRGAMLGRENRAKWLSRIVKVVEHVIL